MAKACENCVHHEVCNVHGYIDADECTFFRNKAVFREIVPCKKCKYGDVSIFSITKDGEETIGCYCNLKNRVTDLDNFCPRGAYKFF